MKMILIATAVALIAGFPINAQNQNTEINSKATTRSLW